MKVFNISSVDLKGRRFNGFDAHAPLGARGIDSKFGAFWESESDEEWSRALWPRKVNNGTASKIAAFETAIGVNGKFQFWTRSLTQMPEFVEADVIHLQLVHDHFLTLKTIKKITQSKPTLWTWHDLWPLTGHCIAPVGCSRWAEGCGNCPNLLAPLPALTDRTASEFRRKRQFLTNIKADVHVTTEWMENQVRSSLPAESKIRIHQFPFGVDNELYKDRGNQSLLREQLKIPPGAFVVTARATDDPLKGFIPLLIALDRLSEEYEIVLVTVQDTNIARKYTTNLRVIQIPWTSHETGMSDFYSIGDVFAMPSLGESFGLMALEAMSCSRPVITTAETATAEVVNAPDIEVSRDNLIQSIVEVVKLCIKNPQQMKELGQAGRERAMQKYSFDNYLNNLENLYRSLTGEG